MKEHIEVIKDSFVDYAGKTHHFMIAAVSSSLPTTSGQLKNNPTDYDESEVYYDVDEVIDDYGTNGTVATVTKCLKLGVSICNPEDTFDEKVGALKATARARANAPVLFSTDPGIINTTMVRAVLQQEAEYLKNNPENFIEGYEEMKQRYNKRKEMESMADGFSDVEKSVVEEVQKNPMFLDNVNKYLEWLHNQKKGKRQG